MSILGRFTADRIPGAVHTDNTLAPTFKLDGGGTFDNAYGSQTAALKNGGFVTVYRYSHDSALAKSGIEFNIRGNEGSFIKKAFVAGSYGSDYNVDPEVCALNNGGFAVGWAVIDDTGHYRNVFAKIYDSNGNQLGSKVSVATSAAHEEMQDIIGLQDGGFYIVHYNEDTNQLIGQRYSAIGEKVGDTNVFIGHDAQLSLTLDGRINLVWHNKSDVHHVILDPRDSSFFGTENSDLYIGTPVGEAIEGNGGDDTLYGAGGDDTLDGGAGTDSLNGGKGDDTYNLLDVHRIDPNIATKYAYDFVTENADSGIDTVQVQKATVFLTSYTLGDNIENGQILGTDNFNLTGNGLDNQLVGNAADNYLAGLDGADLLNGHKGNDTLAGGAGNDTYILKNVHRIDPMIATKYAYDMVVEDANAGTDTVLVQRLNIFLGGYTLTANVEIGKILGSDNFDLIGNDLDNQLLGNAGNNYLSGLDGDDLLSGHKGNDTLAGGAGDDTYVLKNVHRIDPMIATKYAYDTVVEDTNAGTDTVVVERLNVFLGGYTLTANVENARISGNDNFDVTGNGEDNKIVGNDANNLLTGKSGDDQLIGGLGADTLLGNTGDDTISGGSGNDYIDGGAGRDVLQGDAGSDVFAFGNDLITANVDYVKDFSDPDDTIWLKNSVFSALATGTLPASGFRIGNAALDGNDHIIYNSATGALFYDEDGSGSVAQVRVAILSTGLPLTSDDFFVF